MIKGSFVDEKIIQLRRLYMQESDYDITVHEVYIRDNWVRFIPFFILNGQVKVLAPDNFIEMPDKIARVRYISRHRPPVILTSDNYSENLGYHILRRKDKDLDTLIRQMQNVMLLHAPESVLYESGGFISGDSEGRWFEYKNFTVNDETYNLQFLLGTDEHLLAGTFNCRMKYYAEWKKPILKALEHITINAEGCI